ncbi:MAG TPA: hypothetical protein VLI39_19985 [Sedimentisphaerales bacterium]|nr:hypothetical protein [Sedimentisphaerales bacterium]
MRENVAARGNASRVPGSLYESSERFEPRRVFECDFFQRLLHFSPLKHQRVLRLAVLVPRHGLVKMGHEEAVQASIESGEFIAQPTLKFLRCVRFGCRHAVEFRKEPRRPIVGNRESPNGFGDLLRHFLFADVGLRARALLLCAAQVVVALLLFGRDEAAALRTPNHSAIRIFFHDRLFRVALDRHDLLALVEKRLRDERLVLAFVELALEADHPVVDRIFERLLHLRDRHGSTELPREAESHERFADALERLFAGRVPLEYLPHKRCFFRVGDDRARRAVVEVTHRCPLRPDAVFDFLALAALDVFAQVVDVIF